MQSTSTKPRSLIGIFPIALLLGPVSLMLWLGRWRAALLYVLASLLAFALLLTFPVFGSHWPATLPAIFDAFNILGWAIALAGLVHAIRIRKSALPRPWYSRWYVALLGPLATALVVAFGVRTFLYQPFNIPSAAMYPTLKIGDYLSVSKFAYGYGKYSFNFSIGGGGVSLVRCCPLEFPGRVLATSAPQRGEIAVFKLPTNTDIDYIKRIIGLPGDRIQMRDGVVYINGMAVKKERIEDFADPNGESGGSLVPQFLETLPNGVKYRVLDIEPDGGADNTEEYLVPEGHYFMMGDNRDNSQDSRYLDVVGYIPEENFVGPVALRFWSKEGFGLETQPGGVYPHTD